MAQIKCRYFLQIDFTLTLKSGITFIEVTYDDIMKYLLLSLLFCASFSVMAKEGLFESTPKKIHQNAWNNTFMYTTYINKNGNFSLDRFGTISVLFQKKLGSDVYLGMITAKHVIKDNLDRPTKILKNIEYDTVINTNFNDQSIGDYKIIDSMVSSDYDLGLLIIKVSEQVAKDITPHTFAEKCDLREGDSLTILGFPAVMQRADYNQRVKVTHSNTITKRWSSGEFVNTHIRNEYGAMLGTTADAMHGNSGGPVLDEKGKLVSIQAAVLDHGVEFFGNNVTPHSWIVDCKITKNFALKSWDRFIENLEFGDYSK
jgi:S1-C subfamily serine protease